MLIVGTACPGVAANVVLWTGGLGALILFVAFVLALHSRPGWARVVLCGLLLGGSAVLLRAKCSRGGSGEQAFYAYWLVVLTLVAAPWCSAAAASVVRQKVRAPLAKLLAARSRLASTALFCLCAPVLAAALHLCRSGHTLLGGERLAAPPAALVAAAVGGGVQWLLTLATRGSWARALLRTHLPYTLGASLGALGAMVWPLHLAMAPRWAAPAGGTLLFSGVCLASTCRAARSQAKYPRRAAAIVAALQLIGGGVALLLRAPAWPPVAGGAVGGAGLLLLLGAAEHFVKLRQPHKLGCTTALALLGGGIAVLRLAPWGAGVDVGYGLVGAGCALGIIATGRSRVHRTGCARGLGLIASAGLVGGGTVAIGAELLPAGTGFAMVGTGALLRFAVSITTERVSARRHRRGGGGGDGNSSIGLREPLLPSHRRQESDLRRERESLDRQKAELDRERVLLNLERQRAGASGAGGDDASAPPLPTAWQWQDEYGNWNNWEPEHCSAISAAMARGDTKLTLHVKANNTDYELELGDVMKQKNASTGVERGLRPDPGERWGGTGGMAPSERPLPQVPSTWTTQQMFVQLSLSSAEAVAIVDKFHETLPRGQYTVELVERVQNVVRWLAFQSKKSILNTGLVHSAHGANEQVVWHGAAEDVLNLIVMTGFNRDFSKVAAYGRGSYFARDASYSANPRYSVPNAEGKQFLLLVNILAGEPCVGTESMKEPPSKPHGVGELHESMVDNLANPSIFVLSAGTDDHACPTYRIRFRKM